MLLKYYIACLSGHTTTTTTTTTRSSAPLLDCCRSVSACLPTISENPPPAPASASRPATVSAAAAAAQVAEQRNSRARVCASAHVFVCACGGGGARVFAVKTRAGFGDLKFLIMCSGCAFGRHGNHGQRQRFWVCVRPGLLAYVCEQFTVNIHYCGGRRMSSACNYVTHPSRCTGLEVSSVSNFFLNI